jgi:hypothetical protein
MAITPLTPEQFADLDLPSFARLSGGRRRALLEAVRDDPDGYGWALLSARFDAMNEIHTGAEIAGVKRVSRRHCEPVDRPRRPIRPQGTGLGRRVWLYG